MKRRGKRKGGALLVSPPYSPLAAEQPARVSFLADGRAVLWVCRSCPKHLAQLINPHKRHIEQGEQDHIYLEHFEWNEQQGLFLVPRSSQGRLTQNGMEVRLDVEEILDVDRLGKEGAERAFWQRMWNRFEIKAPGVLAVDELPKRARCPRCQAVSILLNARREVPKIAQTSDARSEMPKNNWNGLEERLISTLPP